MIQIVALRQHPETNKLYHTWPGGVPILRESLAEMFLGLDKVISEIPEAERYNIFYTCAHHMGAGSGTTPIRKKETFIEQEALFFDIDGIDKSRKDAYLDPICEAIGLGPESFTIVYSGNGIQLVLFISDKITENEFFKTHKPHYQAIAMKVMDALNNAGLPCGKVDTSVWSPERIMRLPGTLNVKPNKGTSKCELRNICVTPIPYKLEEASGLGDLSEYVSPHVIRKHYPKVDTESVITCNFLKWCIEHPDEVHEPDAFDMMSLLAYCPGDRKSKTKLLGHECDHLGKELARKIVSEAVSSESLARQDFDSKWEQSSRYGGRRCTTLEQREWEASATVEPYKQGCKGCPYYGIIETPLELKSEGFIATEDTGFWKFDKNGGRSPEYNDMLKAFSKNPYVVNSYSNDVWQWESSHYVLRNDTEIKGWAEDMMNPKPMENHRNEFMNKIYANNVRSERAITEFLHGTTWGKINLKNGTFDIMTKQLIPHDYKIGFRYTLPYGYDPHATCPNFDKWMDQIMLGREDLKRTLLEMMAYCLWPEYSDHCFVFLIGGGSNGKSTFLRIVTELLGRDNISSVSLNNLVSNKFMGAELDRKLANVSAESGGKYLTPEHLSSLKELTGGDTVTVERKHGHPFQLRNTAKLIFAMNELPKFPENNIAVARREIVIPFDYDIHKSAGGEDPTVEDRILAEIPGIFNRCLKAMDTMIAEAKARAPYSDKPPIRVFRGGAAAEQAKLQHVIESSNVLSWAQDNLEFTNVETDMVTELDAFERYKSDIKMSVQIRSKFVQTIKDQFIHPSLHSKNTSKPAGKTVRVIKGCKWKSEEIIEEVC